MYVFKLYSIAGGVWRSAIKIIIFGKRSCPLRRVYSVSLTYPAGDWDVDTRGKKKHIENIYLNI